MGCEKHGVIARTLSVVNGICPKGCNFDGKSMVVVGLLRWFFNLQREENQLVFEMRGTSISTGEISDLSEDFLLRFYALHRRHIPKLKTLFESNGGMVLHADGTGEAGDDIVFSTKEGVTGITLDAQLMPSESKKYVKPFLKKLHDSFGIPIVVVRDMSKQIRDSVSDVFPDVLQLVCHYHFVKNLGKIIFKERYESLRKSMVSTKRLSQLTALKEEMLHVKSSNSLIKGECIWTSLSIEYLLQPREQASGYPFVLPYFEIMHRMIEVKEMLRCIVRWNADHNLALKAILDLSKEVDGIIKNKDVRIRYFQIKRIFGWFEEVRKLLNVSRHLSGNERDDKPVDIKNVKEQLKQILKRIKREGEELGETYNYAAKSITDQFQNHWDELFTEVYDKKGNKIEVARDNGIEERSHRWSRMHTRRRTGRSRTTNDMAKYGALLAVLSNLENKTYVEKVLTDVDDFVYEMQNITPEEIKEAKKLIKPYQHKNLVRSDKKRASLLHEFVDILESSEDANDADEELKNWLSKLQNLTTK